MAPEFNLIRQLQDLFEQDDSLQSPPCAIGIGDDAAVLDIEGDDSLVVCTDTLVEGVHFPVGTDPGAIGHKALAVNLSDLAAMAARPAWFFLSITMPGDDPAWFDAFSRGLLSLARQHGVTLAGGDTTSGPLSICITALGRVERGQALTRAGAGDGDRVVVSGYPGQAAMALADIKQGREPDPVTRRALDFPQPRIALGRSLAGLATSCIDLSDGLAADLNHILARSSVGAVLELERLPRVDSLAELAADERWRLQLSGGDDYELCFTVPSGQEAALPDVSRSAGVPLTVIGHIRREAGLSLLKPDGSAYQLETTGYEHFSGSAP